MTNHLKEKPSASAEISPTGRHYFTQLNNSAQKAFKPSAKDYTIHNAVAAVHVQQSRLLNPPTSTAEITEITPKGRQPFTQLMTSANKAHRPSGKKGSLINGLAAIQVEQTRVMNWVGRFSLDEPIIDDSRQELILDRNINPNLSVVPQQDTTASQNNTVTLRRDTATSRQNTTAFQEDTAALVETSSLSSLSTLSPEPLQQTAITNFFSIPHIRSEATLVQQSFKVIFPSNVAPPFFRVKLPEPNKRVSSTTQLAFACHILLNRKTALPSPMSDSPGAVEDDTEVAGLKGADRLWMDAILKDPTEQDRLRWLAAQVVIQFLESNHKDAKSIAEVTLLGSILDRQDYRGVLSSLIRQLEEPLLDLELLLGLMYFLRLDYLIDDDLVRILRVLRRRLKETHMQLGNSKKPASEHIYLLAIAVSRVLDTMVEGSIKGLNRTEEHRPLLDILAGLKDSPDIYLKHQATYAWQALQYIGDDESPLETTLRIGGGLVMAGLGVASAFKLDINGLFNGLSELGDVAGQVLDATKAVIESTQAARDAGEGVMDSVLKGFRTGEKRAWYPALQGARVFIREGQLAEFKRIIYEAPCRHEQEFQWGVCQLLGEMVMDPIWDMEVRQQAVYLLEDLHRSDSGWTKNPDVRVAIRSILLCIFRNAEEIIQVHVNSLSQDSRQDCGDNYADAYPLITRLPVPESSLLLDKVLKIPSLEYNLYRVMTQRLKECQQAIYIPPHAKANLEASNDKYFPLMDKIIDFLESDRKVFLILGDSGSGKSTFNRHLYCVLTKDYILKKDFKQDRSIPIFIYLPALRNPETELVSEHLRTLNFTDDDIRELKRDRKFIIICDSYDETRLSINLYMTNKLNQLDQWNAKMIISCRSNHVRPDYPDIFQPKPVDRYSPPTPHLFQEAVIVPFSRNQIEDYVKQFAQDKRAHTLLHDQLIWSAEEYMRKLEMIPDLMSFVENPFLLNVSLMSLPYVSKDDIKISKLKLIRIFIDRWIEVNKERLMIMKHSGAVKAKLDELFEIGFKQSAIRFLENLTAAIYSEQAGRPIVEYVHSDDKETWKAKFFGPDVDITLLRQSSPLTCKGNQHSFIHHSLLEYFRSAQMSKLISPANRRENGQPEHTPCISQTDNQQVYLSPNDQREQDNSPSPSANTCDDIVLGAEFDGSVSSDDEFEDALEFIPSNSSERIITQVETTSRPAIPKSTFWVQCAIASASATGAAVASVRTVVVGAEALATGGFIKVDGIWKRTIQVLTTRKAHVDKICPIAKTSYVYYDDEVYDAVLTENNTGVTYVTQLIYDAETKVYYVYQRYGETDYNLNGPHKTIEAAKEAFQLTYKDKFDVEWTERETVVSDRYTYETKTYEALEEVEEVEEVVDETKVQEIISQQDHDTEEKPTTVTKTTTTTGEVVVIEEGATGAVGTAASEAAVAVVHGAEPAARGVGHAAEAVAIGTGAVVIGGGLLAAGGPHKVDGVWKRTVQVLNTRKAHVDEVCPIAKTSYVYYDDDVYDAVLTEKGTGVTYVTQLIYDSETKVYHVYYRYGETEHNLDGPHKTVEAAKEAFQLTYKDKFDVEWAERQTAVSDKWTYEAKTYETFEEVEEVEEVVDETTAAAIIRKNQEVANEDATVNTETIVTTTVTNDNVTVEHAEKVVTDVKGQFVAKTVKVEDIGIVAKPTAPKNTSWFYRRVTGAGFDADGVAIGVEDPAISTVHDDSHGADHTVSGTLTKVDGVWKRTARVIITRKAHVDSLAPNAKTSYVYYDDEEVYYAVLVQVSTGIIFVTQLLFDNSVNKYYVYIRWGETKYELDGPYNTIESAKVAFKTTYHNKFGVKWHDRETVVRGDFVYKVKKYETFETIEDIEEIVEEAEALAIIGSENVEAEGYAEVAPGHAEKDVIAYNQVDIDVEKAQVGAEGKVVSEVNAEVEANAKVMDDEAKKKAVVDIEAVPSRSFPECKILGIPASLGDLTTENLVSEMSASPIFDDQSLGVMDLEEELDILQFLVDRVHEDPDYTKLLLWTAYKSGAEGIVNQSTKNAKRILEKAGIHFQLQV